MLGNRAEQRPGSDSSAQHIEQTGMRRVRLGILSRLSQHDPVIGVKINEGFTG
jgi:hypothetical protein